jgi:aspartate/methionine/tyrosine aminotransferase
VAGLNALSGIQCATPAGAFFAFPNISAVLERTSLTTEQLASRLLERHGVALLPGTAFGPGGAEHLRISYATTRVALENALARLRESLLHLATAA